MIPEKFKDFFVNSDVSTQQEIVSSLLAMSTESSSLIEPRDNKREFGISLTNSLKVINIDIGFSWV